MREVRRRLVRVHPADPMPGPDEAPAGTARPKSRPKAGRRRVHLVRLGKRALKRDVMDVIPTPLTGGPASGTVRIAESPRVRRWRGVEVLLLLIVHLSTLWYRRVTGRADRQADAVKARE